MLLLLGNYFLFSYKFTLWPVLAMMNLAEEPVQTNQGLWELLLLWCNLSPSAPAAFATAPAQEMSSLSRLPTPNWLPCLQEEKYWDSSGCTRVEEEHELVLCSPGTVLEFSRELLWISLHLLLPAAQEAQRGAGRTEFAWRIKLCFINQLNAHKRWSQIPWKCSGRVMNTGCNTGNSFQTLEKHCWQRNYTNPRGMV